MVSIDEFLLARIAEDQAVAREAIDPARPGTHWTWAAPGVYGEDPGAPRWLRTVEEFPTTSGVGPLPAFPLGYEAVVDPRPAMAHIARHDPARVLAECAAKRRIVELHRAWPVLAQTEPKLETVPGDLNTYAMRMTQRIQWLTEQEYREKFGDEPPTGPMLRALASVYADHPDFDEAWRA